MSGSKRQFGDISELIAAGLVQTGDETYISTNVVNLSTFDGTPQHGLPCNFNQERTLQIIGNTSRSQVGIQCAEIQTKTLPIFQPQVKIGLDVDALIYEVGYSAVWSGCLLNGSQAGSTLATLTNDTEAQIQRQQHAGAPTFQNDFATVQVYDAYNNSFTLTTMDRDVKHTLLKAFIDYHLSSSNALFQNTPFKPYLIPSRVEPIITLLPLRTEADNTIITGTYAVVKDASGFAVGDRVHLLGHSSTANNTEKSVYAQITSICTYADLIITGSMKNPSADNPNINTSTVLVFGLAGGTPVPNLSATEVRTGGYAIDTHVDNAGGHIEFLVDQFEFRPQTATLVSSSNITATNTGNRVTVTVPAASNILGQGFLRKDNWPVPVEFTSTDQPELNGVYTVLKITGSSPFTVVLKPLTITALTAASYTSKTGTLRLAPNGYTVDRRLINSNGLFLNCIGYQPSSEIEICVPVYPPAMTRPTRTWKRAYSVELAFSTYKNLRWQTQDVDITPNVPVIQQDFGIDSGSSYYNVYDFQQFINTSVNPTLNSLLLDEGPVLSTFGVQLELDSLSLNQQLSYVSSAYQSAFVTDPDLLVYNPLRNYFFGAAVIYSGYVWTPQKDGIIGLPPDIFTTNWYRIGDAPLMTSISRNLVFVYTPNVTSAVTNVTVSGLVTTFTVTNTGYVSGQTITASGFPLVVSTPTAVTQVACPGDGTVIFTMASTSGFNAGDFIAAGAFNDLGGIINGTYGIYFLTGTTLICNNPNNLSAFPTSNFTGSVVKQGVPIDGQYVISSLGGGTTLVCDNPNNLPTFTITAYTGTVALSEVVTGMTFTCPDVANVPTTPEKVRKMKVPKFKTRPMTFLYSGATNLLTYEVDTNGFGTTNRAEFFDLVPAAKFGRDLRNYNYMSWGLKNATEQGGDESITFESNSSFKFLFDNFQCKSIRYVEPTTNGLLVYWLWYQDKNWMYDMHAGNYTQSFESLTSAASPVQSIVILSKTIPVVQNLLSPPFILTDTNTALKNQTSVVGDADSILGEFYIPPGALSSSRSVIRYQPEQVCFYSLQSTKFFKQFDYIVCYRHRITQKLVPINLSNYGSVNIKFVFKPT